MQQADESLALAWENCSAAREELGDQRTEVRRAVALGRSLLDPLAVLASLCGEPPIQERLVRERDLGASKVPPTLRSDSFMNCFLGFLSLASLRST